MADNTNIQAVLFDYGMVLSGPPSSEAWANMCGITGYTDDQMHRAYWAHRHDYDRGTLTGEEYWKKVASNCKSLLPPAAFSALLEADTQLWTQINPPMVEWARHLQRIGLRTGILSNLGDAMAAGVESRFDWIADFHHCTWSYTLKLAKPELAIYHHAAAGLGANPHEILFIDDRADNIAAARQVGMIAIQYLDHAAFERELVRLGLSALLPSSTPLLPQKG